jgi:hypothetical protein
VIAGRELEGGAPVVASPAISMSGWASRIMRSPPRTSASSSAIRTRITSHPLERQAGAERIAAARSLAGGQDAAVEGRALAHPEQAEAAAARARGAAAVVEHLELERALAVAQATLACAGPACLSALVRPSWTIRYAERSMPGGSRRGSPSTVSSTGRPGGAHLLEQRVEPASTLGWGASEASATGSRSSPSMPAQLDDRLAAGVLDRHERLARRSGAVASTCSAAPAWSTITLTLCATASCISRAIRARSSATASRASAGTIGLEVGGVTLEVGGALPALAHPAPSSHTRRGTATRREVIDAPALDECRDLEQQNERRHDHGAGDRQSALAVRGHAVERDVEHDPRLQRAAHARTSRVARVAEGDHRHQHEQRRAPAGEQRQRDRRADDGVQHRLARHQDLHECGPGEQRHDQLIAVLDRTRDRCRSARMRQTYARPSPRASPAATIRIPRSGDTESLPQRTPQSRRRATTAGLGGLASVSFPTPPLRRLQCSAPPSSPSRSPSPRARAPASRSPPTAPHGTTAPRSPRPRRPAPCRSSCASSRSSSSTCRPSAPATARPRPVTSRSPPYRVLDATGAKRLGRAHFVCTSLDHRGAHEQCTGTIALPDGQLALQGDADNVAVVGGSGAYAGARGTATGTDHPDSVDVTVHFLP